MVPPRTIVHLDADAIYASVEQAINPRLRGRDRIVRPNTRPGHGITINAAEVKEHPFQQEVLVREFSPDGAMTDW